MAADVCAQVGRYAEGTLILLVEVVTELRKLPRFVPGYGCRKPFLGKRLFDSPGGELVTVKVAAVLGSCTVVFQFLRLNFLFYSEGVEQLQKDLIRVLNGELFYHLRVCATGAGFSFRD